LIATDVCASCPTLSANSVTCTAEFKILTCSTGYFYDSTAFTCTACDTNQATCSAAGTATKALTCNTGYTLVTSAVNGANKNCKACGSNAATCSPTVAYATGCSTGY